MDVDLQGRDEAARPEIRQAAERIAALPEDERRTALVEAGFLTPHWPAPYGLGADAVTQIVIDEELARAGVARPDIVIAGWALPTIVEHGNDEQRERFVLPSLRGELVWCQLFSEPGPAPTWPRCAPRPSGSTEGGSSPARRCGPRSPSAPTGASASRAPTPTRPSTRASPTSSST